MIWMKGWIGSDVIAIILGIYTFSLIQNPIFLDTIALWTIYPALLLLILTNFVNIIIKLIKIETNYYQQLNATSMMFNIIAIVGLWMGKIIARYG